MLAIGGSSIRHIGALFYLLNFPVSLELLLKSLFFKKLKKVIWAVGQMQVQGYGSTQKEYH